MKFEERIERFTPERRKILLHDLQVAVRSKRLDSSDQLRLTAYLTTKNKVAGPQINELRDYLSKYVPGFMIPAEFVLLDSLPLTPNGKVDRRALSLMPNTPPEVSGPSSLSQEAVSLSEEAAMLLEIWKEVLGLENLGVNDNFFGMGGDSILAIQVVSKANQSGILLSVTELFSTPTISQLVASVSPDKYSHVVNEEVSGVVALTPIHLWFLNQNLNNPHRWNQSVLLELNPDLKFENVEQCLEKIIKHHDVLRLKTVSTANGWSQQIIPAAASSFKLRFVDLSEQSESDLPAVITENANLLHASIRIDSGLLLEAAFFQFVGSKPAQLLVVCHHMAVDGVSWTILLEHIETLLRQKMMGDKLKLPSKTVSYKQWSDTQLILAQNNAFATEYDFWAKQPFDECSNIPFDFKSDEFNDEESARSVESRLDHETTKLLIDKARKMGISVRDVLLASVLSVISEKFQQSSILVGLEGHGREDCIEKLNVSQTAGWFTSFFPQVFSINDPSRIAKIVEDVSKQMNSIPNHGIGFGILKYLTSGENILKNIPNPQIIFNYLGRVKSSFSNSDVLSLIGRDIGSFRSPESLRSSIIEVNTVIENDRLLVIWTFCKNRLNTATIEWMVERMEGQLTDFLSNDTLANEFMESGLDEEDLSTLFDDTE